LLQIKIPGPAERFKAGFCLIAGSMHFTVVERIEVWLERCIGICVALSRPTGHKALPLHDEVDRVPMTPWPKHATFESKRLKEMSIFVPAFYTEPKF
jgi:hypothetical protein